MRWRSMPMRDRLADSVVVPRLEVVVHAQVQRVQAAGRLKLQVGVGLDRREVGRTDERHAVDRAGLEFLQTSCRLGLQLEGGRCGDGLVAPVVVEAAVVDLSAAAATDRACTGRCRSSSETRIAGRARGRSANRCR